MAIVRPQCGTQITDKPLTLDKVYISSNSKTKPGEVNQSSKNFEAKLKYQVKPVLNVSEEIAKRSHEHVLHNEHQVPEARKMEVEEQNSTEPEEIVLDDSSEISTFATTTERPSFPSKSKSEPVQGVTKSKELPVANADVDSRYGH